YEKKSTIFTTNANFKDWGEVFQDSKLANAILDRILHHATVINIVGDSYRIKNHLEREKENE
ncbi:ATP-binding protein, partial [Geobacillus thermodenitrificans]